MSYVQCLTSYPQQYKLTHDVSLDSLNDLDNDVSLSPEYKPFASSWTNTGPNHAGGSQLDNDYHNTQVNANNVRNTEAHGQSRSWLQRHDNGHAACYSSECISDYIHLTPAHGSTPCGTEHLERTRRESSSSKSKRKEVASPEVHNLIDSDDLTKRPTREPPVSRSPASSSPDVQRRMPPACATEDGSVGNRRRYGHSSRDHDGVVVGIAGGSCHNSIDESDICRARSTPQQSLEEELAATQRPSSKSSPEDELVPTRSFSRQDSRASDSSYSDENCRRTSEDGSDCSQRSVRSVGRSVRTTRKGRRPRKLPEIPPSAKATAATITFMTASGALKSCSLTQLSNFLTEVRDNKETEFLQRSLSSVDRSLADELSEADPTLKLANGTASPTVARADESSPDSNVEFEQAAYRKRHTSGSSQRSASSRQGPSSSEREPMSMSSSPSGSQCDGELKVKAEERARETLKGDSLDFVESEHFLDEIPGSPRRYRQRATSGQPRQVEDMVQGRVYGATNRAQPETDDVFSKEEDSSPDEKPQARKRPPSRRGSVRKENFDIAAIGTGRRPSTSSTLSLGVEDLDATHRGCHKFIPRHSDELFIEIGDPIAVQSEDDDLWCAGYNLRTNKYGIFPSAYATDLSILDLDEDSMRPIKFILRFLGSVEVSYHKGTEVLAQAINKVALNRRQTMNAKPAPVVLLEINEQGVKMTEKTKKKEKVSEGSDVPMSPSKRAASIRARLAKIMSKEKSKSLDHFFTLKNISFCGYHPRNERYFAFITKHPLEMRFACHVFLGEHSTKTIAEAVGTAFRQFYSQYMAFVHPTEDIYIE